MNKILKYVRHSHHGKVTRYDKQMRAAFGEDSPWAVLRTVNHICVVMRKVGKKLMKRYGVVCESDYCCLDKLIEEYRMRKVDSLTSRRP